MKEEPDKKPPKMHDLFIDIGVTNREEAQKLVRIGDPITLVDEFQLLRGDLAISRAFDNRVGTFAAGLVGQANGSGGRGHRLSSLKEA